MSEGTHLTSEIRRRAVDAVMDGMTKTAVSAAYGVDRNTIARWVNKFEKGGDEDLVAMQFASSLAVRSVDQAFQISAQVSLDQFSGGNFILDLDSDRLFSLTSSGSDHTIRAYSPPQP